MGQAQIILREDNIGEEEDVVVTLVESGQAEYLGQVSSELSETANYQLFPSNPKTILIELGIGAGYPY